MANREDFATRIGQLIKAQKHRLDNARGSLSLDSAGGVQHAVDGTRVWWVNHAGDLVEGTIPWERITGAPESGADTHRLDNTAGYLTLDSAGGVQHGTTETGRVWWVNDQGTLQQGTVPWSRITDAPDVAGVSPAALKVVPLALTTGQTQANSGHTARGLRFPIRFNAPIHRWRLHVRNWNPRLGQVKTGALSITGIWVGDHSGDGQPGNSRRLIGASSTPADGSEWVSPWLTEPIGGDVDRLLCIGYYGAATGGPYALYGGSWQTAAAGSAGLDGATVTRHATTPLDIWIEVETPADTPVIAGVGDSLTVGVGATLPVHESWVSQYARRVGGLPMHIAHAGDSLEGFLAVNPEKVTRWANLARADAVVFGLGSNDISGPRSLTQLQADYAALSPVIEAAVGPVRYVSTIQPRGSWDETRESKRAQWNEWVSARPGIRGVLDFASVVSTDGDTLLPQYDSGDGTHLNTAGYLAESASITTPLTAPPTVARVTTVEDRLDALTVTSGVRSLTGLFDLTSGNAYLQVQNGHVTITLTDAVAPGSGSIYLTTTGLLSVAPEAPIGSKTIPVLEGASSWRRAAMDRNGALRVWGYTAGAPLNGSISWPMTRPVPAVWPGSATT